MLGDAEIFLSDFGIDATFTVNAQPVVVRGLLDVSDIDVLTGEQTGATHVLMVETVKVSGVRRDTPVSIGVDQYTVRRDPRRIDDGVFSQVLLTKK
jgi:hypothetical protein